MTCCPNIKDVVRGNEPFGVPWHLFRCQADFLGVYPFCCLYEHDVVFRCANPYEKNIALCQESSKNGAGTYFGARGGPGTYFSCRFHTKSRCRGNGLGAAFLRVRGSEE